MPSSEHDPGPAAHQAGRLALRPWRPRTPPPRTRAAPLGPDGRLAPGSYIAPAAASLLRPGAYRDPEASEEIRRRIAVARSQQRRQRTASEPKARPKRGRSPAPASKPAPKARKAAPLLCPLAALRVAAGPAPPKAPPPPHLRSAAPPVPKPAPVLQTPEPVPMLALTPGDSAAPAPVPLSAPEPAPGPTPAPVQVPEPPPLFCLPELIQPGGQHHRYLIAVARAASRQTFQRDTDYPGQAYHRDIARAIHLSLTEPRGVDRLGLFLGDALQMEFREGQWHPP